MMLYGTCWALVRAQNLTFNQVGECLGGIYFMANFILLLLVTVVWWRCDYGFNGQLFSMVFEECWNYCKEMVKDEM